MESHYINNASAPALTPPQSLYDKYLISSTFAEKLNKIKLFSKIICICDDSTGMNKQLLNGKTKWNELRQRLEILLDIASAYNVTCDVNFLNRKNGVKNVAHIIQLNDQFQMLPCGTTPLNCTFNACLADSLSALDDKRLLIILFVEGCPTSDSLSNRDAIKEFKNSLERRKCINQVFVSIVSCNDGNDETMAYLNNWDKIIKNVDIVLDFERERIKLHKIFKVDSVFTYSDYIVRILLGNIIKNEEAVDEKVTKLRIIEKYDMSRVFSDKLHLLKEYKIVCICDDSTSMNERLRNGQKKWDEMKKCVEVILDIASAYQVSCDVMFLNRPGFRNFEWRNRLDDNFNITPQGSTPLTSCFNLAIRNNQQELFDRKLLTLIFTDGCPTSNNLTTKDSINEFKHVLKIRYPIDRIFVSIVSCTDDSFSLNYLTDWDNEIRNIDIVEDFENERIKVHTANTDYVSFTFGDYIAKILLGSFLKEIRELSVKQGSCNTILKKLLLF